MDAQKTLLREVFGESSDGEDDKRHEAIGNSTLSLQNPTWEAVKEIKSLWLCRDFLSPQQQSTLLSAIQNEGWFTEPSKNQAMRFGNLPSWAIELSSSIHEALLFGDHIHVRADLDSSDGCQGSCLLPSDILWREPLFDQLIVNVYQPGEVRTNFQVECFFF
uniref:Uncharacterized protein MANES_05G063800 n=1 Tax=Rhizophora mucronata TaxID=61149 RepID=A0A2P2IQE0_RHIMU